MNGLMNPFDIFDDYNRLRGDWYGNNFNTSRSESWMPPVDIRTDDGGYLIEMELPGFQPEQVEVAVQDNVLTIKGHKEEEEKTSASGEGSYVRRERRTGQFIRQFSLPDSASGGDIQASVKDGVLTLRVPHSTQQEPRKIKIG